MLVTVRAKLPVAQLRAMNTMRPCLESLPRYPSSMILLAQWEAECSRLWKYEVMVAVVTMDFGVDGGALEARDQP